MIITSLEKPCFYKKKTIYAIKWNICIIIIGYVIYQPKEKGYLFLCIS